jgi:hypothetical protein
MFKHVGVELGYDDLKTDNIKSGRFYHAPDGNKYPSITTILSILSEDAIREWRNAVGEEEANRVSRHASNQGTRVHELLEDYINNKPINLLKEMPHIKALFNSVKPTVDQSINNVYAQEIPLYSKYLGAAGRVDCIAEWNGVPSVIDFKTSGRIKKHSDIHSYFMQKTFYAIAFEERTGIPIKQLVTLIAVSGHPPQVFIEDRDNWDKQLIETIKEYKKRKLFGH